MENGPLKETQRAGGEGRACACSSAALALDVLQAGGEEKLAGVADPPVCLASSRELFTHQQRSRPSKVTANSPWGSLEPLPRSTGLGKALSGKS